MGEGAGQLSATPVKKTFEDKHAIETARGARPDNLKILGKKPCDICDI
jgi:hypothetical protein